MQTQMEIDLDILSAEQKTEELITAELARQDTLWGKLNERADASQGQLLYAGTATLDALIERRAGDPYSFTRVPDIYPDDWDGFRDYGPDVPNLVVAIAFLTQEVKRLILNGESTERLSRDAWLAQQQVATS
jgi:hypothetical protein